MLPSGCFNSSASSIFVFPYFPVSLRKIYPILYNAVWREMACLTPGGIIHLSQFFLSFSFSQLGVIKLRRLSFGQPLM